MIRFKNSPLKVLLFIAGLGCWLVLVNAAQATSIRTGIGNFGVMGDAGVINKDTTATRASMKRLGVSKLVLPGDNLYIPTQTYAQVWDRWLNEGFSFNVVAIGNHNSGYTREMNYFKMPAENYVTYVDEVKFIVLNSDHDSLGPLQAQWFDQVMQQTTEPLVFVVFHHPFYTISKDHTWTEKRRFHTAMRPMLFKYRQKITALLLGHDHFSTYIDIGGLPVFVLGAAHEQRQDGPVSYVEKGVKVETKWYFKGEPSWGYLQTNFFKRAAVMNFIDSRNDRVLCRVGLQTGNKPVLSQECR